MKYIIILVCTMILCAGCRNQVVEDNRMRAEEVMAIHDEAMAKMTYMHELRLRLIKREKLAESPERIRSAIDALQDAHKGMMVWMREYTEPKSDAELENAEKYLIEQKAKIEQVSREINDSINDAELLIRS